MNATAKHVIYYGAGPTLVAEPGERVNVASCGPNSACVDIKGARGFSLRLFPEEAARYVDFDSRSILAALSV